jgi:DNA-directed RNA polymerase specialized sigma24 family protein
MAEQSAEISAGTASARTMAREPILALVAEALRRMGLREDELSSDGFQGVVKCFDAALEYHRQTFAAASKRSDVEYVAAALGRGEFAAGRRDDVNLWDDVALAALLAQGNDRAMEVFRRRFAGSVGGWERRYSRRQPYGLEDFVGDLLLPREVAGPRIQTYKGHGPLDGWLRQVYLSVCEKRRARDAAAPIPWGLSPDGSDDGELCARHDGRGSDGADGPDERYARLECAERLAPVMKECIAGLDDELRLVLMMAVVDDVPQKHIADVLHWPEYKVTRAKQKAIRVSTQRFMDIARDRGRMASESVQECITLLLQKYPASQDL